MKRYRYQYIPGPCAQYALINGLAVLGIKISVAEAYRLTGVSVLRSLKEGTDTKYIVKAIRKTDCIPHTVYRQHEVSAKRAIDRLLAKGMPIIISVDQSSHWAVLASKTKDDRYRWIDSYDTRLVGYWKWVSVAEWMYDDEDGYCFIGIDSP